MEGFEENQGKFVFILELFAAIYSHLTWKFPVFFPNPMRAHPDA